MRTKYVAIALSLALALAVPALAASFSSDLGYTMQLPDDWSVLSRKQMEKQPKVVDAAFSAAQQQQELADMPKSLLSRVKKLVNAGELDYFFSSSPRFNVSVYPGAGKIPADAGQVAQTCRLIEKELSQQAGRPTRVHDCRSTVVDGQPGIYLVADNYWKNQKYIQVQVQKTEDKMLVFTASSRRGNFDDMSAEFDRVMSTVRIK
jgi:hypothetical protein